MIGTVVVPLDGSELAERALTYGTALAERSAAPLMLVRVNRAGADESEILESNEYLTRVAERINDNVKRRTERGRPADVIAKVTQETADPIIVMSTRGRDDFRRWMAGSVADEVVRGAGVPVWLVRGDKELPEDGSVLIQAILVPVDGSEYGESALDYAIAVARVFGSTIHLLRVVDTPSAYAMLGRHVDASATGDGINEIIHSMKVEATDYLEKLSERIQSQDVPVKTIVLEGYPGDQVIEHERRGFFQLVVMATAGRSGVSRVVFGSVAERVLKTGRSPVMMIRPQQ